jgi:amino acid adenylation domain-containing protein
MKEVAISNRMKIAASQNIKERDYWINKLSGLGESVKRFFAYDYKLADVDKEHRRIGTVTFQLTGQCFDRLVRMSNNSDRRLHMILAAGLTVLAAKYTGSKDIIVGVPIYKQEIDGEFINRALALRHNLDGSLTFKELLLQVRQTLVEAVENQNYPIEALVDKLNLSAADGAFPLFDTAVLLENIHDKRYLEALPLNMVFSFLRTDARLDAVVEYDASLYEKASVERIARHWQQLFQETLFDLNLTLDDINILPREERNRVLFDFNGTSTPYPQAETIHKAFEARVATIPDQTALVYRDRCLTYGELNARSNRLARFLREKGVYRDDLVAVILEPGLEMIIAIIAVLKAGGGIMPIDPAYPEKRILAIINDSGVSLVLTEGKTVDSFSFTALKDVGGDGPGPVVTAPRPQIKDLDHLPLPNRALIDYEKYHQFIGLALAKHSVSLQATRGCPFNCAYCHKIWPKTHVTRSAENVLEEIHRCHDVGIRRFVFIDDIFNLDKRNSIKLFEAIIKRFPGLQLFFPNGLRGDILTRDFIDLMVEAGTVNIDLALESACPRVQRLIGKRLNLEIFEENVHYITDKYPGLLLEMEMMVGFPTETEKEAMMTLEFLEQLKWLHFPNLNILKIFPNTDMCALALENGVDQRLIERSVDLAFHELPDTLPFPKRFVREFQARFMNNYFLSRDRLLQVLPLQAQILTEDELVQKYDSYLPMDITCFDDILNGAGIAWEDLGSLDLLPPDHMAAPGFVGNIGKHFHAGEFSPGPFRVLLLDLSLFFTGDARRQNMLYDMIEEPLGLMYLLSFLNETFKGRIKGKIAKSRIDFDSFAELRVLISEFNPHLIGIRTLTFYREFFHQAVSLIKQWGVNVPIIAGGPYATSGYRQVLGDPAVDLVVLGEGETTFADLIGKTIENHNRLPGQETLTGIPGLAFMKDEDRAESKRRTRDILLMDHLHLDAAHYPAGDLPHVNRPGDLLYAISTSGSTGVPKSLLMEHRGLANLSDFQLRETGVDFQRVLQFASIGFDVSLQEIFSTLLYGGQLYLIDENMKRDVLPLLELIDRNYLNVVYWPPAFLKLIFSEPVYRAAFPASVRHVITAGEQLVINEPLRRYIKDRQLYVHNHYGPAETHVVTTFLIDPKGPVAELPVIGKPVSNTFIYILDNGMNIVPIGIPGQIYIGGRQVARGYLNRPGLTAERFIHRPDMSYRSYKTYYQTGDLARWTTDGNIEFLGRVDFQVKIRGYRVELGEIEKRLMVSDSVREAVVVDNGEPGADRYLCAYIVPAGEMDEGELREMLAHELPGYMVPSYFVSLDRIPVTPNGKVDKKSLPLPGITANDRYIAPGNECEEKLAEIWSGVLGIEKDIISIDDNFFELGGHSLKATILINRVHQVFNVTVSLGEMFKQPTIGGLARYIQKAASDLHSAVEVVEKKEYYPLSPAQKRIYVLQRMDAANTSYNNPSIMVLEGHIDHERFEEVLNRLIKRHETLRTSIAAIGEAPMQRINETVDFCVGWEQSRSPGDSEGIVRRFVRPFDLSRAPLLRVGLIEEAADRHVLMMDMHHIITDGTSMQVFTGEFTALYVGKDLPPLRIQYRDFSQWQNREFHAGIAAKQREFWVKQLQGGLPVLEMPTDYTRPAIKSFEGSRVQFRLESAENRALKELAREENATLYMLLLSICNVLLSKLGGQEDIIVGTPVAGRRHADLHFIIGMFVNTLPMRNYPTGRTHFRDFLVNVKMRTLDAFENQDYPFEDLVDHLGVARDTSRSPIFDVMFVMQNMAVQSGVIPGVEIPGLRILPYRHDKNRQTRDEAVKFDMSLIAVESGDSLVFTLEYCSRLFKEETIERLGGYFKRIAREICKNPDQPISGIDMMTEQEKNRLLVEFNRTTFPLPQDKTIHAGVEAQVMKTPDRIAVEGREMSITYEELNRRADCLALSLKEGGTGVGDIVAIKVERSIGMIIDILGILKAGAAYLPIDPGYPRERIDYMMKDSGAVMLTGEPHAGKKRQPVTGVSSNSVAYVIYTSGSTGQPRGVMVEHRSLVNAVAWQAHYYGITGADRGTQYASPGFDASVLEIFPYLARGAVVHIIPDDIKLEPATLNRYFEAHCITMSFLPTQLCERFMRLDNRSLRVLLAAGDKLRKFVKRNYTLYNNYGPTENTVVTTSFLVDGFYDNIPIGKPVYNNRIYILSIDGLRLQPTGVTGELCIAGDSLARGYLNNPEGTAERFFIYRSHRTYKTGDLARWLADGNIQFMGRTDEQTKIRGFRIEPGEIEKRLLMHQHVKEAIVIARTDAAGDKYLCAYIVSDSDSPVQWKEYLSRSLPGYMIPAHFVCLDKIPLSSSGKVLRRALPEPGLSRPAAPYAPPRDDLEEKLVQTWNRILSRDPKAEPIGIEDNFFDLGGHSLNATTLVSSVRSQFSVNVPLVEFFKTPTIKELARFIRSMAGGTAVTGDERLIHLKAGGDEDLHLFLIHDGTGEAEAYVEFCRYVTGMFNCWGIRADRTESLAPRNVTIPGLASTYIETLKKIQPNGPYYIAGWSLGGAIAFEMARQLEEQNQEIAFLGLIDSPGPGLEQLPEERAFDVASEREWLNRTLPDPAPREKIKQAAGINETWNIIAAHLEESPDSERVVRQLIPDHLARLIPHYHRLSTRELIYYFNINRSLAGARARYIPGGKVTAAVHYLKAHRSPAAFGERWNAYCNRPITFHHLPGDHHSMLKPPHVEKTAEIFRFLVLGA